MTAIANPQINTLFNLSQIPKGDDEDPNGKRKSWNPPGHYHYQEEPEVPDSQDEGSVGGNRYQVAKTMNTRKVMVGSTMEFVAIEVVTLGKAAETHHSTLTPPNYGQQGIRKNQVTRMGPGQYQPDDPNYTRRRAREAAADARWEARQAARKERKRLEKEMRDADPVMKAEHDRKKKEAKMRRKQRNKECKRRVMER